MGSTGRWFYSRECGWSTFCSRHRPKSSTGSCGGCDEHGGMELQKSIWGEGACSGQAFKNFQFYHHHIQYTGDRVGGGGSGWEYCYIMYSMYLQDGQNLVGEFYFSLSLGMSKLAVHLTFEIYGHKVNLITVDWEFRIACYVISIRRHYRDVFYLLNHLLIKLVLSWTRSAI